MERAHRPTSRCPRSRRRTTSTRSTSRSGPAACGRRRTTARRSTRCSTIRATFAIGDVTRRAVESEHRLGRHRRRVHVAQLVRRRRRLQVDRRRRRRGRTWAHATRITSRASSIDPTNPDVVYVAAMGHLYSRQRRARRVQDDRRREDVGEECSSSTTASASSTS